MANKITIYTALLCPYCTAAKKLLSQKGAEFNEIDVTFNASGRAAMAEKTNGRRSVPQIFVGNKHVGGCDDLYALERADELDALLAS